MYLIEVVALARLPRTLPQSFSYFSLESLEEGAVVEIELNHRRLFAMVTRSIGVKQAKQDLRSRAFQLKKIQNIISRASIINARDRALLQWISEYYLAQPSTVLKLILPSFITDTFEVSSWPARHEIEPYPRMIEVVPEEYPIERYQKAVEHALQNGRQALILVPEIERAETLADVISEIVPKERLLVVTSSKTPRELRTSWHRVRNGEPLIIVGTRTSLFFPFTNLGLIIIDRESSPAHKSWDQEPRYDGREVAAKLHSLHGGQMILAGYPPSLNSYHLAKDEQVARLIPSRELVTSPLSLFVDMAREIKEQNEFVVFSQVLKDKLRNVIQDGGRAFLFVNRKGFAPFILCQQCGFIFRCSECSVPLVYHVQESLASATLLCHHCGSKNKPPDVCLECGSHKLKAYGIGIERVAKDLKKMFPNVPVLSLLHGEPKETKNAKTALEKLKKMSCYIAIGTEFAIPLRLPRMELAAIISIDSALSLPDFMQTERLFRSLSLIRRLSSKIFILQSYAKEPEMLIDLFHGSFEHFAEKELKERRRFHYPPFGELIKLTVQDSSREEALTQVKRLYAGLRIVPHYFGPEAVEVTNPYPAYIEKKKGNFIFHILIKIMDASKSRDMKLLIAEHTPDTVQVDVGPQSLL
ncbi:MAG: primosomal protein N' [Candidatus Sungbacteria bacterium]|uniref:Probable replication restart protein PriA n=1 Tax=Candidatus Sungiibacteriota bacterium TaxID=2750080 RepID=A0A9D6LQJ8_9BACT|nr:primosomal protein N' [Candidatus Sungbacteria bacterium]